MKVKNIPMVVCRVAQRVDGRNWNRGDTVAIPAHDIKAYRGVVEPLSKPLMPIDVRNAGGVAAYLAANPSLDLEKGGTEAAIKANPGATSRNPEHEGIDLVPDPETDTGILAGRRAPRRGKAAG